MHLRVLQRIECLEAQPAYATAPFLLLQASWVILLLQDNIMSRLQQDKAEADMWVGVRRTVPRQKFDNEARIS